MAARGMQSRLIRALVLQSFHLAPRYHLKNKMDLQEMNLLVPPMSSRPENYVYTPEGLPPGTNRSSSPSTSRQNRKAHPRGSGRQLVQSGGTGGYPHFLMEDFIVIHAPCKDG